MQHQKAFANAHTAHKRQHQSATTTACAGGTRAPPAGAAAGTVAAAARPIKQAVPSAAAHFRTSQQQPTPWTSQHGSLAGMSAAAAAATLKF